MDGESQNARDTRIESLWRTLDTKKEGQIDINGLRKGLKKMDHPLKNADALLHDVLEAVDTSGDGQIQFNGMAGVCAFLHQLIRATIEFRVFVEHTEKELWQLFESIDRNHDGTLDKGELRAAFARAGLTISNAKLDKFFDEVDTNHDGQISFAEWRNFLLFIPAGVPNLGAVLSYYSATGTVNAEGDVHINASLEGIGEKRHSFAPALYTWKTAKESSWFDHQPSPSSMNEAPIVLLALHSAIFLSLPTGLDGLMDSFGGADHQVEESILTLYIRSSGYFLAGGLAGMISRTATAPLDRLKVYLIAQTSNKKAALDAAKSGSALEAASHLGKPLIDATKDLWAAGGIRNLFAGNGLNVVKVMPESAIKFGAYEASKRALAKIEGHNDPRHLHSWSQFLAGGIGGVVSQCVVYPLDTLKFRMQCETVSGGIRGNALIAQTAQKMWSSTGFRAYYRGLPMGLAGMFPYSAIDLFVFENLKNLILGRRAKANRCHEEDVKLNNIETGCIGMFSGGVSATTVYPMNLIRTRLQAQGTVLHPPVYGGIWDVTKKTIQNEGLRGLFKGATPNLLKVAPAVSISYIVYENSKRLMGLH
ncbi:MAG: hypothetical protein Q9227_009505 [Pyrenula ochraceoflavens]